MSTVHTALRPYMTKGIALVGASVIAAAPITLPPPELPAVDALAVTPVRTLDVEPTAFIDALVDAIPESIRQSFQFVFERLPAEAVWLIGQGDFAQLVPLAVAVATNWPFVPALPFFEAIEAELPLPFGTFDGVVRQSWFMANALPYLVYDLINQVAQVIDGDDSLATLPHALITSFTQSAQSAWGSFEKIVTAFGPPPPAQNLAAAAGVDLQPLAAFDPAAFGQALLAAAAKAVTEEVAVWFTTLPESIAVTVGNGDFATLGFAISALPFVAVMAPMLPFIEVAMTQLPFPAGGPYGVLSAGPVLASVPIQLGYDFAWEVATVIDGDLPLAGLVSRLTQRLDSAADSVAALVTGFIGSLFGLVPGGMVMQEESAGALASSAGPEPEASIEANSVPRSLNSRAAAVDTVTLTVDSPDDSLSTPADGVVLSAPADETRADGKPSSIERDDETPNGATDLSDGNMAAPGTVGGSEPTDGGEAAESEVGTEPVSEPTEPSVDATGAEAGAGSAGDASDGDSSES